MRDELVLVRCRPAFQVWFLLAFLGAAGLFLIVHPYLPATGHYNSKIVPLGYQLVGAAMLISVFVATVYAGRTEIVCDDLGIRWRGTGKWKEARWEEVSDYYDNRSQKGHKSAVIRTRSGTVFLSAGSWTHTDDLRAFVAKKAVAATTREWAEMGERDQEQWPLKFFYQSKPNLIMMCVLGAIALYWTIDQSVRVVSAVPKMFREMGPGWTLLMASTYVFTFLAMLLIALISILPLAIEFHKRRNQVIHADADGLTFEDGPQTIRASWDDITEYYIVPRGPFQVNRSRKVVTRNGTFDYVYVLQGCHVLDNLIQKRAPGAAERGARDHPELSDNLVIEKADSSGRNYFTYRRRSNRALIWFIWGLLIATGIVNYAGHITGTLAFSYSGFVTRIAVFGSIGIYFSWRFRTGKIVTDSWGIMQCGPFNTRTLPWGDVKAVTNSGSGPFEFFLLRGSSVWHKYLHSLAMGYSVSLWTLPPLTWKRV